MKTTIILRFRDLVTEDDGTIREHMALISRHGEVWWGWWMRQHESWWMPQRDTPIRGLFCQIANEIQSEGFITAYLFDSGRLRLYSASVLKVSLTPTIDKIPTPEPQKTPSYYHRAKYPAWFLLSSVQEKDFVKIPMKYHSFTTENEQTADCNNFIGREIASLAELKRFDVTLWGIQTALA